MGGDVRLLSVSSREINTLFNTKLFVLGEALEGSKSRGNGGGGGDYSQLVCVYDVSPCMGAAMFRLSAVVLNVSRFLARMFSRICPRKTGKHANTSALGKSLVQDAKGQQTCEY